MKNHNDDKRRTSHSHRGPDSFMAGDKATDFKGTLKKFLAYMKPFKGHLFLAIIMCIGANIFGIISPKILGQTTDLVIEGVKNGGYIDFNGIMNLGIMLIGLYILELLSSIAEGWLLTEVSTKITFNLREAMSRKLDRLPLSYFDRETKGEIQSRFTTDIETINNTLGENFSQTLSSFITLIGVVIMMFSINWILTLIVFMSIPISIIFIRVIVKFSQKHFSAQQALLGKANSHIEEMYKGHLVIKSFNGEEQSLEKFDEINQGLKTSAWKSQFLSSLIMPIASIVGNLTYVVVCIVGGFLIIRGKITIGSIQAFIQYIRFFNRPLSTVANSANVLQSTVAAAERIFALLDEAEIEEIRDENKALENHIIKFENVSFGYKETPVINNFSFQINEGEKIAIVGPTGAGKTTLVKLLLGFYPLNSGRITLGGNDIESISKEKLRENFAMVLQDTWLFTGTIADNISYGKSGASFDEIKKAAEIAHCSRFISGLPKQYETIIQSEVSSISQGEKQLLTIARAVLANSPILILDEATSSIDTRTEVLIQDAMNRLMAGKTSIIIAHRLSTIKSADKIIVLDKGDVVEIGNHKELIAMGGVYNKMYGSQF